MNKREQALRRIAEAITPGGVGATVSRGGHVASLTEGVIHVGEGLHRIAEAIADLAGAVREKRS